MKGSMNTTVSTPGGSSLKCRSLALMATLGTAAFLLAPSSSMAQVALGTSQNFGVLAGSTVTNTGPSVVTGDVGVSPGTAIVGFPPGTATGLMHAGDADALQAQTDLTAAYNDAAGRVCNVILTGQDLGLLAPLVPGVYCFATSAQLTGNLTLDFQGNPAALFIFKIGSTLTTASASQVLAVNTGGAVCLPNIIWQVGSSATLGTGSNIAGNILALTSITLTTGANLRGRALERNGAVTLDSNLTVGGCPIAALVPGGPIPGVPVPGQVTNVPTLQEWNLIFLGLLLAAAGGWYARRRGLGR
jgi:hypothetical protein